MYKRQFLKEEKQGKIERAARLARLIHVGKKLLATGNGRCNLTNRNAAPEQLTGYAPKNFFKASFMPSVSMSRT